MLQQLVYLSQATRPLDDETVNSILEASRKNNPAREITGILIVQGDRFLQALEGDSEVLRELFLTIKKDPRHMEITIISWEDVTQRDFPEWAMGYKNLAQLSDAQKSKLVNFDEIDLTSTAFTERPGQVHSLFQSLLSLDV